MAEPYKMTAIWEEARLPAAIRGSHNAKSGVWGVLRVIEGAVFLGAHFAPAADAAPAAIENAR